MVNHIIKSYETDEEYTYLWYLTYLLPTKFYLHYKILFPVFWHRVPGLYKIADKNSYFKITFWRCE